MKLLHSVFWVFGIFLCLPVHLYRLLISPLTPRTCRFTPTCSRYFIAAVRIRGPLIGPLLGIYRLLRCQPFGRSGFDPVPRKGWRNPPTEDDKKLP